ncbi:hypothetical protein [Alkaliflexus imshenetskii]|uniref:hypothetical protein n=1 Tax=Alkaliflexus imshenetskii TaxID=286730 RepID=UPI000478A6C6|nr:hypothetical protein [Alkaliflexus imshenetskii]
MERKLVHFAATFIAIIILALSSFNDEPSSWEPINPSRDIINIENRDSILHVREMYVYGKRDSIFADGADIEISHSTVKFIMKP